ERLDVSARRLLREKFLLGLFDNPYVDADAADSIVGAAEFRAAGDAAQRASVAVLSNDSGTLPFAPGVKLYVEGIAADVAAAYGEVVETPAEADIAILRLQAPYEERATVFENFFHAGSLDFPDDVIAHVADVAAQAPTVVDVFLDRPAILEPIVGAASAVVGNWGVSAEALLDVLSGAAAAHGKLPFDIPRSMAAVEAARPDVPFDTEDPLFGFGHGLTL
ncbi:MAG: glycoside hydrolase family 3 C-terminal domain-containing protein, partial [Microbacterium sp.]